MKSTWIKVLGAIAAAPIAVLVLTPQGSASGPVPNLTALPSVTILDVGSVQSLLPTISPEPLPTVARPTVITSVIPGPVETVIKKVPGPTRTIYLPGPTKTIYKTIIASPKPAETVVRVVVSPSPVPFDREKIEREYRDRVKFKVKLLQATIGLVGFITGILISIISLMIIYYIGRKEGREESNSFLELLRDELRITKR